MNDTAIRVENLGKRYIIGQQRDGKDGLRHRIEEAFGNPLKWVLNRKKERESRSEEFWALKDVSFEVKQGEVVGIIGRNGAGKSTLLKILSRITEPTSGYIKLKGRVSSLLEVGTGFHQELTGRENIYLNGAILGMTRVEIRRKFDEIVAFAEVGQFLDTPVKRYSSGMYVRLAFSVAAHLDPDILIIDEVLAVGDSQFQAKCLGKMEDVASTGGRTILFVSHNMGTIGRLCKRSILLESGKIVETGATNDVITRYLASGAESSGRRIWNPADKKWEMRIARPCEARILNADGEVSGHVAMTRPFIVELRYEVSERLNVIRTVFRFFTGDGTFAFMGANSSAADFGSVPTAPGCYVCRCQVPGNLLNEGKYFITITADIPFERVIFHEEVAISLTVDQTGGVNSRYPEKWPGAVCPMLDWSLYSVASEPSEVSMKRATLVY